MRHNATQNCHFSLECTIGETMDDHRCVLILIMLSPNGMSLFHLSVCKASLSCNQVFITVACKNLLHMLS